jgi:choline dehydrogenase-like flavoprotein
MPLSMGKVLGGGSSINGMGWARGHKNDWDFFASESGDTAWNYESVLKIYRRIEYWQGAPDPTRRGTGGLVFVQSAADPNPIAPAMVEGARSIGMPTFDSNNGRLMEDGGRASIIDVRARDGKRLSRQCELLVDMSQSGHRAHTFPSQQSPHRHASRSPASSVQPVQLHPIPRWPRAICSARPLALRHSIGAPLNQLEATIRLARPESLVENAAVE